MSELIPQTYNLSDEEIMRMADRSNPDVKLLCQRLESSNDCLKRIYDIASKLNNPSFAMKEIIDELSEGLF